MIQNDKIWIWMKYKKSIFVYVNFWNVLVGHPFLNPNFSGMGVIYFMSLTHRYMLQIMHLWILYKLFCGFILWCTAASNRTIKKSPKDFMFIRKLFGINTYRFFGLNIIYGPGISVSLSTNFNSYPVCGSYIFS